MEPSAQEILSIQREQVQELMARKRHDLAEQILRQILTATPDDWVASARLAGCLLKRHAVDEALAHARRAVALAPGSELPLLTLASIYDHQGDQFSGWAALEGVGLACFAQGKIGEATEFLTRALSFNPFLENAKRTLNTIQSGEAQNFSDRR